MNKRDRLPDLLGHILDECRNITAWTAGLTQEQFENDPRTHYAVARAFENIGEAAGNILKTAPELAQQYPEIPFKNYNGMRNILAHQYYRVDLEIVWNSVGEIAKLQSGVTAILANLPAA